MSIAAAFDALKTNFLFLFIQDKYKQKINLSAFKPTEYFIKIKGFYNTFNCISFVKYR